jgi:hypothetical protein
MLTRDFGVLAQEWNDLEATGIPLAPLEDRVGVDARHLGRALMIRNGSQHGRNEIRELSHGRFGYILSVFVRRDLPGKIIIRDSWIWPPWEDPTFEWLADPKDEGKHPGWYTFPGDREQFARVEVLNHRINCGLSRGDFREGLLLGVGSQQPPITIKNYDKVAVTFTIEDQLDCRHREEFQMRMTRLPVRAKEIHKRTTPPLFSRPDVVAPRCSAISRPVPAKGVSTKDVESTRRALEEMISLSSKREHKKVLVGSETH